MTFRLQTKTFECHCLFTDARQTRAEMLEFNPENSGLQLRRERVHGSRARRQYWVGSEATAEDFAQKFGLNLETDSSAAKGVATRRGVGKIRHLHTPLLWLQRRVTHRDLQIWKTKGGDDEADIGTKPLSGDVLDQILTNPNLYSRLERANKP